MGCDIHCYIEHRKKDYDRWSLFGGRINPGRNYGLFGLLAGVRGGNAIIPVRGRPSDMSWGTESEDRCFIHDGEKEEANYVASGTAAKWVEQGYSRYILGRDDKPTWVTNPDWHTHSYCTPDEWEKCASAVVSETDWGCDPEVWAMLAAMRELENRGHDARVVFWFDN